MLWMHTLLCVLFFSLWINKIYPCEKFGLACQVRKCFGQKTIIFYQLNYKLSCVERQVVLFDTFYIKST